LVACRIEASAITLRSHVAAELKRIVNLTRGSIVCDPAVVADRPFQRLRGLLGRASLPAGEGLLLKPAPSIHTVLMRFPIDVVFLDRDLRVLKLVERLAPWRMASARRARAALELAAGEIARRGIGVGDVLGVIDEPDRLEAIVEGPRAVPGPTHQDGPPSRNGAAGSTRVVLITSDRRFRVLAAALLAQRGCSVTSGERMADVAQRAMRDAADVVVLDATASLTAAAREAERVEALEPPVGVVMVAEEPSRGPAAMLVFPKWDSFDVLYNAIDHARFGLRPCR
jgi:uncharacterized membrane protein (UPF0127 family)